MARTVKQIKAAILAFMASKPSLAALDSTSQVSPTMQFVDAISSALQVSEQLGDLQEQRMQDIADEAVPGTSDWLRRQVFKWQFGDQIQLNSDLSFSYATVDTSKNIVSRCAIQQIDATRDVLVKAAKDGATPGTLTKLTKQELDSLKSYLARIKFAGIRLVTQSDNADRVVVNAKVYYSGEYVESNVLADVTTAINSYLSNIDFDGTLYLSKLEDAIQSVTGVTDVELLDVVARPDLVSINDPSLMAIERVYDSQAGYIITETAAGSTLADTITMISV